MLSKQMQEVIARVTLENLEDVQRAIQIVVEEIRSLPDYETFANALVVNAIKEEVYRERSRNNRILHKKYGTGHSTPTVNHAHEECRKVDNDVFNYLIGGTRLGILTGSLIKEMCSELEARSIGVAKDLYMLRSLREEVGEEQTVQEAFKGREQELVMIQRRAQRSAVKALREEQPEVAGKGKRRK